MSQSTRVDVDVDVREPRVDPIAHRALDDDLGPELAQVRLAQRGGRRADRRETAVEEGGALRMHDQVGRHGDADRCGVAAFDQCGFGEGQPAAGQGVEAEGHGRISVGREGRLGRPRREQRTTRFRDVPARA